MANQADVTKELAARPQAKTVGLTDMIKQSAKELGKALPDHLKPERLVRIAMTAIRLNPKLAQCTPESFLGALFTAAQIGVEPVAGRAYILPFNNSRKLPNGQWMKVMEAQFMLGYKGVVELFYRHAKAVQISWGVVGVNELNNPDHFSYEEGTAGFLKHRPLLDGAGEPAAYYAVAKLAGGGTPFLVMSAKACLAHGAEHSKTYDKKTGQFYADSPWSTSRDAMSLKTVLIQLAKTLPLSVELQQAIGADESSREYKRGVADVFELPDNTAWQEPPATKPALEAQAPTVNTPQIAAPAGKDDLWDGNEE